jgi:tetraacyldisaccharide 4'-kinase
MRAPEFWTRDDAASHFIALCLAPLGAVYGAVTAIKARSAKPFRPSAKVVCIGNLTAGGSGKTPCAIAIAEALRAKGQKVCFLTRGYGGKSQGPLFVDPGRETALEVGDEALLLARTAPVIVAAERRAGALLADIQGFDVIVMDDGHQNFQVAKDLAIVVLDTESPFGNGRIIPAGPLREPVAQGLARADCIVALGNGETHFGAFRGPIIRAILKPTNMTSFQGARVFAFAGIGRPTKFFETLRGAGAEIVDSRAYGDHHAYSPLEVSELKAAAQVRNARLVTTEKDYVRLSAAERDGIEVLPVSVEFENRETLERLLAGVGSTQHR